ncbi:MAG TPA: trehalose-phosphatase [Candidatus Limnocylindrales bacterium]|nr:trehalose-phosphatase [Candidatus Limnocylindrales bacterium]
MWKSKDIVEKRLKVSFHVLLLLDYDGTLTEIAKKPHHAILPAKTKKILNDLKLFKQLTLGIVSGRGVYDIKKLIGIEDIVYAGNHGLEWEIEKVVYVMPGISETRELYLKILSAFGPLEEKYKGIFIEDKNLTISIHYRMLNKDLRPSFLEEFENFITPYLDSPLIKLLKNKMVFDIMPNVKWGKGGFINWLISTQKSSPLTIYIGDDRTDEDAFSELKDAITIKVGSGESEANYFLHDIDDTVKFLEFVCKSLTENTD